MNKTGSVGNGGVAGAGHLCAGFTARAASGEYGLGVSRELTGQGNAGVSDRRRAR